LPARRHRRLPVPASANRRYHNLHCLWTLVKTVRPLTDFPDWLAAAREQPLVVEHRWQERSAHLAAIDRLSQVQSPGSIRGVVLFSSSLRACRQTVASSRSQSTLRLRRLISTRCVVSCRCSSCQAGWHPRQPAQGFFHYWVRVASHMKKKPE
jgi:hypothetical protein